ncbi:uncharacterized protein LOC126843204 [Adelges cooleyi]|uniref:uncharacterized protein LOC126843204 n=1 Tax=Adelges cooleyi TaxID=133065 RepID=UPI00217F55A5|nr:uncharacterized protein LOC126843204 [Adelges cooleyi]
MVHSAILKKIVFCLALLLRQSVQLLETGYKYPSNNVPIENDSLYDDLKCAYLFSGLTHMRLVKLLIDRPYDPQTKLSTGHLASYSNVIKYQIASLYSVQVKRMGALWLVHLYTSMVTWSYENLKNEAEDYKKMVATTEYVIEKLLKDITGCREGNSFDRYHRIIKPNSNPKPVVLKKMMGLVNSEANKLLAKNYIVFQEKLCDCHFQETLKIRNIFMNGLGLYDAYKTDLMNVYNVNVDWSDTSKRLEKSWYDARTLDWATDNLENIKSYLTLCYSFLKILMFRLTLKHLQYLQNYIESDEYVLYAHQWYNLVDTFGSMLNLTKDLHVKSLLTAIYNLCNGIEKVDSVFQNRFFTLAECTTIHVIHYHFF